MPKIDAVTCHTPPGSCAYGVAVATRSQAEKLLTSIPKAAGKAAGRRSQYSASTRRALIDVALKLFTTQGYAGTSLDAIVAGAKVTKGALYHHFSGKQAVFEAVFEKVESDASDRIRKALRRSRDRAPVASRRERIFFKIRRTGRFGPPNPHESSGFRRATLLADLSLVSPSRRFLAALAPLASGAR